jgi:hypothetical protein
VGAARGGVGNGGADRGAAATGAGAGLGREITAGIAEPYVLQLTGEWARAAERWREIGCPYEAALALADADEEAPQRRALEELQRLGRGRRRRSSPGACASAGRAGYHAARGPPRGGIPPA